MNKRLFSLALLLATMVAPVRAMDDNVAAADADAATARAATKATLETNQTKSNTRLRERQEAVADAKAARNRRRQAAREDAAAYDAAAVEELQCAQAATVAKAAADAIQKARVAVAMRAAMQDQEAQAQDRNRADAEQAADAAVAAQKVKIRRIKIGGVTVLVVGFGTTYKLYIAPWAAKHVLKMKDSKLKSFLLAATFANKSKTAKKVRGFVTNKRKLLAARIAAMKDGRIKSLLSKLPLEPKDPAVIIECAG